MIERILNDIEELKKRTTRPLVTAGINMVLEIIKKHSKNNGWIPCSERLPEENQNVIACFAHGTVTELMFYEKKFHGIYDYDEKVIVAWQPLPEAYHR